MNAVNSIQELGGGMIGRIFGAWKALAFYVVKDMLIAPIYGIIETASPIKGITISVNKIIDYVAWDTFKE